MCDTSTFPQVWAILVLSIGIPLLLCGGVALGMWTRHTFAAEQAHAQKVKTKRTPTGFGV